MQAEAAQPGDGDPDRGGLAPLAQREDPLGPSQAASGQGAVAQRGDQASLRPQPGGLVLGGDVGRDLGCAHGLLQLVQQPVRALDDRRAGDLVAHGPLPPKVLVPRERRRRWSGRARRRRPACVAASSASAAPSARTSAARLLRRGGRPVVVADSPVKRSISSATGQPWSRVSSSPSRPMASTPAAWSRKCHLSPASTRRSCSSSRPATCSVVQRGEVTDQVGPAPLQQVVLGLLVPLLDDRGPTSRSRRRRGPRRAAAATSARSG